MRLDRNAIESPGKYALIKRRKLTEFLESGLTGFKASGDIEQALAVLTDAGILDWCDTPETEAFVMRLKDKYAGGALSAYAISAADDDPEYAADVMRLAQRSGSNHPLCRRPD